MRKFLCRFFASSKTCVLAFGIAVLLLLVACGEKAVPAVNRQHMEELGNEFVAQLNDEIVALREQPERLLELEAVVVTGEKTYQGDRLFAFYEDYRVGQNTELLLVFDTKSFVVNKLVFEGNAGYYFRYEFDPFDNSTINVTSQPLDSMTITEDPTVKKVELTLSREKMADIVVTLRNLVKEEPAADL